jgi:hypothetical protein
VNSDGYRAARVLLVRGRRRGPPDSVAFCEPRGPWRPRFRPTCSPSCGVGQCLGCCPQGLRRMPIGSVVVRGCTTFRDIGHCSRRASWQERSRPILDARSDSWLCGVNSSGVMVSCTSRVPTCSSALASEPRRSATSSQPFR